MLDFPLKICFVVMIGIGFGAVWLVSSAAAMDYFPKSIAVTVIGVWTLFLGLGSIVSPIICGWSIDFSGSYTCELNFGFVAAILSVVVLLPLLKQPGMTFEKFNCGMKSDFRV